MKKYLIVLLAALVMLTGQVALAAAQVDSLQTVEIIADDNVNIFDYSFFDSASEGKLIFTDLKNTYGGGASMSVDINTDTGADKIIIEVSGAYHGDNKDVHTLSVSLGSDHKGLMNVNIKNATPVVLNIYNGKLTIAAAGSKRVVNNVTSFAGTLTTQSISGTLNVYNATETVDAGSSIKTKNVNTDDIGKIISIFK